MKINVNETLADVLYSMISDELEKMVELESLPTNNDHFGSVIEKQGSIEIKELYNFWLRLEEV
jgi:hypothetical protein